MNAKDGSGKRMLTNDAVDKCEPVWSPDGKRIAYATNNGVCVGCNGPGDDDMYAVNADGTGEPINLANSPEDEIDGVFSPDGKKIAVTRFFAVFSDAAWQTDYEIFVKDLASGAETNVTNSAETTEVDRRSLRMGSRWPLRGAGRFLPPTPRTARGRRTLLTPPQTISNRTEDRTRSQTPP